MKKIMFGFHLRTPATGIDLQNVFLAMLNESGWLQLVRHGKAYACFESSPAYHYLLMAGSPQDHHKATHGTTPVRLDHPNGQLNPHQKYECVWLLPVDLNEYAERQGWYVGETSLEVVVEASDELQGMLKNALLKYLGVKQC